MTLVFYTTFLFCICKLLIILFEKDDVKMNNEFKSINGSTRVTNPAIKWLNYLSAFFLILTILSIIEWIKQF